MTICVNWCKLQDDEVKLLSEEGCSFMLTDCLFQNDAHKKDLEHVRYLIKLVGKNWLRYKTMLVLFFLPMQTFLEYTEFRCWRQHQSFEA